MVNESMETQGGRAESHLLRMEESYEHLRTLIELEDKAYPLPEDYLHYSESQSDLVNEFWRRKLCEWVYEVVDHFKFDREVVSVALNYLDRAVSMSTSPIGKKDFQLYTVTSLYMAIKIHGESESYGNSRLKLKIASFVELSRGCFSAKLIEDTEKLILKKLNWHVNPPTMLKYIHSLIQLCPAWTVFEYMIPHAKVIKSIYELARYLTELSVCFPDFAFKFKDSTIAYCAILCAIEGRNESLPMPYEVRVTFVNNISHAMNLFPADAQVRAICRRLKSFQPEVFEQAVLIEDPLDRSLASNDNLQAFVGDRESSPVSVAVRGDNECLHTNGSCRKRIRSDESG